MNIRERIISTRKTGTVVGFPMMSESTLESMKRDLGLRLTLPELKYCQKHFLLGEKRDPSLDEIYFIDALREAVRYSARRVALSDFSARDPFVYDTFTDLMDKARCLGMCNGKEFTLADAAAVSGAYMDRIGVNAHAAASVSEIGDDLSVCVTETHEQTACADFCTDRLRTDSAFVILCRENDGFEAAMSELRKTREYRKSVRAAVTVDSRGIAYALCKMADGIYADPERIPGLSRPIELSYLSECGEGSVILAMSRDETNAIIQKAYEFGITASYFAKSIRSDRFTVRHDNNAPMTLLSSFIRTFADLPEPHRFVSTRQLPEGDKCRPSAIVTAHREESFEGTVKLGGTRICSYTVAPPRTGAFISAADTVLYTCLKMISSGVQRDKLRLNIRYLLPRKSETDSLSFALDMLLGAYRSTVELCVPEYASCIEYANTPSPTFVCTAFSDVTTRDLPESFMGTGHGVYLIATNKAGNGMPDFERLCHVLATAGNLLSSLELPTFSARPFVGNVSEAIGEMCGKYGFSPEPIYGKFTESNMCGFIVESAYKTDGIRIGCTTDTDIDVEHRTAEDGADVQ